MSKIKIAGHASGSGTLTIQAPDTSSSRTITLPDATGTLLNSDGDGSSLTGIAGKQTIWIPAAAITPTASNGCATRTQVETTAGRPDMDVLDFDASADEHAQFSVAFPKSWNLGTITFQVF